MSHDVTRTVDGRVRWGPDHGSRNEAVISCFIKFAIFHVWVTVQKIWLTAIEKNSRFFFFSRQIMAQGYLGNSSGNINSGFIFFMKIYFFIFLADAVYNQ